MSETIREYDAKVDNKKRLTLRETPYEYYHIKHFNDGRILLQPRELVAPYEMSDETLELINKSVEDMKAGKATDPVMINTRDGKTIMLGQDDFNGLLESLYLAAIPGMKKKLTEGRDTPLSETVSEDEVEW